MRVQGLSLAITLALIGCRGGSGSEQSAGVVVLEAEALDDFGVFRRVADAPFLAIHAALMRDATIMFFGGSQHEPTRVLGNANYAVWDPTTESSTIIDGPSEDMFCAGHAHLPDGRLFIAGGNEHYQPPWEPGHNGEKHFTGLPHTWTYDYRDRTFTRGADMWAGRWYPTVILGPGDPHGVIVMEGHPESARPEHENISVESGPVSGAGPFRIASEFDGYAYGFYPRAHVVTGAEVFITSPREDLRNVSLVRHPASNELTAVDRGSAQLDDLSYADWGTTSVLLPYRLTETGRYPKGVVLRAGGVVAALKDLDDAERATWRTTRPRPNAPDGSDPPYRKHANAVLLPTGEVFVVGGVTDEVRDGWHGSRDTSVLYTEIFRPTSGTWHRGPSSTISRNYHSNALLLPDGRVWLTGGNKRAGYSVTNQPNGDGRELRVELFEPWYFGHPDRPRIESIEQSEPRQLAIHTTAAREVSEVLLMAPGSATHAFDVDQRVVYLPIVERTDGVVIASVPIDAPLPSGDYLLFVTAPTDDSRGRVLPSIGGWITL